MFKFFLNLGSKRPEITQKKINAYAESNKPKLIEPSKLEFGINDDDVVAPVVAKQKITIRSTPKSKLTINKMAPTKLYNHKHFQHCLNNLLHEKLHLYCLHLQLLMNLV